MPSIFLLLLLVSVGNAFFPTTFSRGCNNRQRNPRYHVALIDPTPAKGSKLFLVGTLGEVCEEGDSPQPLLKSFLLRHEIPSSTLEETVPLLLDRMIVYFESMVDPITHRLFLLSRPSSNDEECQSHVHCPLRELGSLWDATTALKVRYRGRKTNEYPTANDHSSLEDAIQSTLQGYSKSMLDMIPPTNDGERALYVSPEILKEPPNIAHNALLLLSYIGAEELNLFETTNDGAYDRFSIIDGLAKGILAMQRPNGGFRIHFSSNISQDDHDDDDSSGIEFFPGEAMTALMEVYHYYLAQTASNRVAGATTNTATMADTANEIMSAMSRAFSFYSEYYRRGREQDTIDANYSIWQIQAFSRLAMALNQSSLPLVQLQQEATIYCFDLCLDILRSPAWKLISRGRSFYPNLSTIEIACGLDGLCQCARVLESSMDSIDHELSSSLLARRIDNALEFLVWSQEQVPATAIVGYGGLGYGGYCVLEQRLDVTGHALGAVSKLVL